MHRPPCVGCSVALVPSWYPTRRCWCHRPPDSSTSKWTCMTRARVRRSASWSRSWSTGAGGSSPKSLSARSRWLLRRRVQRRYGATVAHLLRIFWIWCRYGANAPYFFGYGADTEHLRRIFWAFLACLCPKPNGELCWCSLPVNDGLLMIDTPEFIRICSLTYEMQGEGTRMEQAPSLRGL